MTKSPDDKAGAELLARQLNARLAAEGLGIKAQKDRRALAREARVEAAARRQMFEMRRRPGYVAGEAREPFQAEVRLIRATDHLDATGAETSEPEARPTFSEMREMRDEYPNIPATVIEHRRRKTAALNKIKEGTKKNRPAATPITKYRIKSRAVSAGTSVAGPARNTQTGTQTGGEIGTTAGTLEGRPQLCCRSPPQATALSMPHPSILAGHVERACKDAPQGTR